MCKICTIVQNLYTIVQIVKQLFELCKLVYLRMIFLFWNTTDDFTNFVTKGTVWGAQQKVQSVYFFSVQK